MFAKRYSSHVSILQIKVLFLKCQMNVWFEFICSKYTFDIIKTFLLCKLENFSGNI